MNQHVEHDDVRILLQALSVDIGRYSSEMFWQRLFLVVAQLKVESR